MEQLSHDTLLQYTARIKRPGPWCGPMFDIVLQWYEKIKEYMWLKLIGLLSIQSLFLMKSAVDAIMSLEYTQQIDHGENSYGKDLLLVAMM
jgi:hypothetical protein